MEGPGRFHGLLLTFRRPAELTTHLRVLAEQTAPLDTLLVVDNDADPAIRALAESHPQAALGDVRYLAVPGNPGPAGGIDAGMLDLLARADDGDWLVLLDDDDPPPRADTFERLQSVLSALRTTHDRVGGVGLWGGSLRWTGRLRAETGTTPAAVDYLPGGSCAHYAIGGLRAADRHHPELFFGFDDLDLGLSLAEAGWPLWSSGLARAQGLGHMVEGRTASASVSAAGWRRYYSLRNLVIVLRRHGRWPGAVVMSLAAGLAKPILNLPRHPRLAWAHLVLNGRALCDGWRGRLGKTIDPQA